MPRTVGCGLHRLLSQLGFDNVLEIISVAASQPASSVPVTFKDSLLEIRAAPSDLLENVDPETAWRRGVR